MLFFFFFFQAEDGIRDHCVTGVQTCALPIFRTPAPGRRANVPCRSAVAPPYNGTTNTSWPASWTSIISRSEERRVGKECRSAGVPEQKNKKKEKVASTEDVHSKQAEAA